MDTKRSSRRLSALLVVLFLAISLPQSAQQKGLTAQQIDNLLKVHAPDSLVASQIRSRGVSFPMSPRVIERFSSEGAGPQTLAVLKDFIKLGSVTIQTQQDGLVTIDGKEAGRTTSDGILLVKDLAIGTHQLSIQKDGYQSGATQFTLAQNEMKRISLPLQWAGGFLSISVKPAGATIRVISSKPLEGPFADLPCPPGAYTVAVEAPDHVAQVRTIQVMAGEHHLETFVLELDPAAFSRKLAEAESKLNGGDPASARSLAERLLAQQPNSAEAQQVIAIAAFEQNDMNRFVDAGTKSLRSARPITIPLMHLHVLFHPWVHQVDMAISESGLAFASSDDKCKIPHSIDFALIASASVIRNQRGSPMLHIVYGSKPHAAIVHDVDLVPIGSEIVERMPGQLTTAAPSIREPGNSVEQLQGLVRLMAGARR